MDYDVDVLRKALKRVVMPKTDEVIDALIELGFEPKTVEAIELVPLIFVAWANGKVARKKADTIMGFAEEMKVGEASKVKLEQLLTFQPDDAYFRRTIRVIVRMHDAMPPSEATKAKRTLIDRAALVGAAGGKFLGLGKGKATDVEEEVIERITKALKISHIERAAARKEKLITSALNADELFGKAEDE